MSVLLLLLAGFGLTIVANYLVFMMLMRYLSHQLQRSPTKESL